MTTLANMDAVTFTLTMTIVLAFLLCYFIYQLIHLISLAAEEASKRKAKEEKEKEEEEQYITCDRCGYDFKRKYTTHIEYNSSYPVMTKKVWRELNMCFDCYADIFIPSLKALKGRIMEHHDIEQ